MSEPEDKIYLEERKLVRRYSPLKSALVNTLFLFVVFYASWWIFQDPRGVMRMYTPYVGYMWCRWLLVVIIWIAYIFDFWPFKREWLYNAGPAKKGIIFTVMVFFTFFVFLKIFFEFILGELAISYFSPRRLAELGITDFYALEYSAQAILMFAAIASWLSPSWVVAADNSPWQKLKQPVKGFTVFIWTFLLSMIVYFVFFHSQMGILFDPWQKYTSITPPWWHNFADTVHGNFNIAWIMCCTVMVWVYETIWERYPFSLIKTNWLRRTASFFGIIAMAFCFSFFFYYLQELIWGVHIRGDRRLFAPDWRWLHVGEIAIFWLVPVLFIKFYCNNAVNKFSKPVNILLRTIISMVAAIVLYYVYYQVSHFLLGTQKGFSHPQQFPMIPMIWFINVMLINYWFMDGWPGWKLAGKKEEAEEAGEEDDFGNKNSIKGLVVGFIVGVVIYLAVVYLAPAVGNMLTIFNK